MTLEQFFHLLQLKLQGFGHALLQVKVATVFWLGISAVGLFWLWFMGTLVYYQVKEHLEKRRNQLKREL